jgi:hypothetical protein
MGKGVWLSRPSPAREYLATCRGQGGWLLVSPSSAWCVRAGLHGVSASVVICKMK